jgi:hypothetical protein
MSTGYASSLVALSTSNTPGVVALPTSNTPRVVAFPTSNTPSFVSMAARDTSHIEVICRQGFVFIILVVFGPLLLDNGGCHWDGFDDWASLARILDIKIGRCAFYTFDCSCLKTLDKSTRIEEHNQCERLTSLIETGTAATSTSSDMNRRTRRPSMVAVEVAELDLVRWTRAFELLLPSSMSGFKVREDECDATDEPSWRSSSVFIFVELHRVQHSVRQGHLHVPSTALLLVVPLPR